MTAVFERASAVIGTSIRATRNVATKMEGLKLRSVELTFPTTKTNVCGYMLFAAKFVRLCGELGRRCLFVRLKRAKWGDTNINVVSL
jgi:hypothetical protein